MIRIRYSCALGALLAAVTLAPAAEFYVNGSNQSGTELGTQQSPFRSVQAAIDAAVNGDEIRVATGTYVENLRIEGKAILLNGGYSADWVRDVAANQTTLSSAGGNAVLNLIEADATIDGFRIIGGTGSIEELPYGYFGGGIYSRGGSPTISNNIIEDNDIRSGDPPYDYYFGGGIYVSDAATVTIVNNVVRGNYAGRGAGVSVIGQEALIQGNTIENNVAVGDHGGGMYIGVVDALVTQNIIRGNEVGRDLGYGWGGGLIVFNSGNSAEISFNEVYENFAAAYGAGEFVDEGAEANIHHELIYRNFSTDGCEAVSAIAVDGGEGVGSRVTINHCTVVGNVCENATRGNGLQVEGMSEVTVTNSIFWNNSGDDFAVDGTSTLTVTFTNSEEGFDGTGNISADPQFVDEAADNYRLAPGSPAIDAGDPDAPFDSEPDPNGGRADLGAYGNPSEESASDANDDGDAAPGDGDDGQDPDDPVDADCSDGLFCNGQERRENSQCVAGTPPCDPQNERCNEADDSCAAIGEPAPANPTCGLFGGAGMILLPLYLAGWRRMRSYGWHGSTKA